jgi:hypothetical protein
MLIYKGYKIDRANLAQVTITSPGGKLIHAFAGGTDYHKAGCHAMRWVDGLGAAREPDPDADRINAQIEFMAKIKREHKPGESGTAECPFCKAEVFWRLMPSNGHLWARCSTQDCFGIIQ